LALEWAGLQKRGDALPPAQNDHSAMQDFRRLKVWEKSHALALDIYRLSERFPRRRGLALSSQLRRSALSIPANIAEGAGKASSAEFYRYLQIALGSASETLYHLLLARDTGLLASDQYDALSERVVEVRRMLTGLSKKVGSRSTVAATPFVPVSPPRGAR
jgi:four helix bundle protein